MMGLKKRRPRYPKALRYAAISFGVLLGLIGWGHVGVAAEEESVSFGGYFRVGSGWSLEGSKQTAFSNPSTKGNEFRLGNEVGSYMETIVQVAPKGAAQERFQIRLALTDPQNRVGDELGMASLREAYVESAEIAAGARLWAGKRYLRSVDSHPNDWFYFADSSGSGAGLSDWRLSGGKLSLNYLQRGIDSDELGGSAAPGTPITSAVELKWYGAPVADSWKLNFWALAARAGGYRWTPQDQSSDAWVDGASGTAFGLLLRREMFSGFNDFSVMFGQDLAEGLEFDQMANLPTAPRSAVRWRLVNNLAWELSETWGLLGTLSQERWQPEAQSEGVWNSAVLRPVWYVDLHWHLIGEMGLSSVQDSAVGTPPESRSLQRTTLALEWAPEKSLFSRPSLRLFATRSRWNAANQGRVGGEAYAERNSGSNLGFQAETWW